MILTDAELLRSYKLAYQQLLIGKSVRVMQKDGRRVEYSPINKATLQQEIQRLEASTGQSRRRGPAGVI